MRKLVALVLAATFAAGFAESASAEPVVVYQSIELRVTGDLRWIGSNYQIDYLWLNLTRDLLQVECTWTGTIGDGSTIPMHISYPIPGNGRYDYGAGGESVLPTDMSCTTTLLATAAPTVRLRFPPLRVKLVDPGAGLDETLFVLRNASDRRGLTDIACRWAGAGRHSFRHLDPHQIRRVLVRTVGGPSTITNMTCTFETTSG